jgi:hypothetical protein
MHAAAFRKSAFVQHLTPYYIRPGQEVRRESPAETRVLPIGPKGQSTGSASGPPKSCGSCRLLRPRRAGFARDLAEGMSSATKPYHIVIQEKFRAVIKRSPVSGPVTPNSNPISSIRTMDSSAERPAPPAGA